MAWIESPWRSWYFWLLFSLCWLGLANVVTSQLKQGFWANRRFTQTLTTAHSQQNPLLLKNFMVLGYRFLPVLLVKC